MIRLLLILWTLWVKILEGLSDPLLEPPDFIEPLENLTVVTGRDATFSCSVSRLEEYTVGWVKADTKAIQAIGRNIVTYNTRVSVDNTPGSPTWKLVIKNVQSNDEGFYMCQINTDPMKSQLAYLTVTEPPNIDDSTTPSQKQVKENEAVVLECRASGYPAPNITWKRENGTNIHQNSCGDQNSQILGGINRIGRGRLCIPSASRESMGAYFCIASNGVPPSVSKRIQLSVLFAPMVRAETSIVGSFVGIEQVSLECNVEASPQTNHFWHKGNQTIGLMERYQTKIRSINSYTVRMILVIQNLREEDAGVYRCQAGEQQSTVRLYVTRPLIIQPTHSSTAIPMNSTSLLPMKRKRPLSSTTTTNTLPITTTTTTTEMIITTRKATVASNLQEVLKSSRNSGYSSRNVAVKNQAGSLIFLFKSELIGIIVCVMIFLI